MSRQRNNKYSVELKLQAVQDYLNGGGSYETLKEKYKLRSSTQLKNWVMWYNGHKESKERHGARTEIYMTKGRKTILEERIEIVEYCIEHGKDYVAAIEKLCKCAHLNRSPYYKWLKRKPSDSERENAQFVELIKQLYEEQNGIFGYRQMTITINRRYHTKYNIKRICRLMKILHLKSVYRKKRYNYIKSTPEVTAENILNREFYADAPNEK